MRKPKTLTAQVQEWVATPNLTQDQVWNDLRRLIWATGHASGYTQAQEERKREENQKAAIERNGDTEPDYHQCRFCGEWVANGYDNKNERHYLSDCRPDLVEHEPGETCTWHNLGPDSHGAVKKQDCYAYQDSRTSKWGDEHKHFYKDGPM